MMTRQDCQMVYVVAANRLLLPPADLAFYVASL